MSLVRPLAMILAGLWLGACAAGTGPAVRGKVVDRDTGGPVENAKVLLRGEAGAWAAVTDRRGEFALNVPPGVYEVLFAYREALSSASRLEVGSRGADIEGLIDVPVVWSRQKSVERGREQGDPLFWLRGDDRKR